MLTVTCSQTHGVHSHLPATGSNCASGHWRSGADRLTALILCIGHTLVTVAEMVCFCLNTSASTGQAVLSGPSCALGHTVPNRACSGCGVCGLSGAVNGLVFEHLGSSCRDARAFPRGGWRDPAVRGSTHSLRV